MRLISGMLLLLTLAACSNTPYRDTPLEGYLPPGEVGGGPNKLFGTSGIPTNLRFQTPW